MHPDIVAAYMDGTLAAALNRRVSVQTSPRPLVGLRPEETAVLAKRTARLIRWPCPTRPLIHATIGVVPTSTSFCRRAPRRQRFEDGARQLSRMGGGREELSHGQNLVALSRGRPPLGLPWGEAHGTTPVGRWRASCSTDARWNADS